MASLILDFKSPLISLVPMLSGDECGIISPINPLVELDQLNLEPAAKTQVAAMFQALLDQTARDAKIIQAKDVKIAALAHIYMTGKPL